jgi:thiol-disulfide isomerase/thioredoxin
MFQSFRSGRSRLSRKSASLILLALAIVSLSCSGSVVDDSMSEAAKSYRPPATSRAAVDSRVNDFNVQMLSGGGAKINDLVGKNKVVLVNFWATWCGPCKREIPDLIALKRQFQGKDVEIIGLTVEEPELQSRVQAFAQQYSINYTIGFAPQDMFFLFNVANGNDPRAPIPQTFVFGRNGKILDSVKGLRPDFRTWAEGAIGYALKNS